MFTYYVAAGDRWQCKCGKVWEYWASSCSSNGQWRKYVDTSIKSGGIENVGR